MLKAEDAASWGDPFLVSEWIKQEITEPEETASKERGLNIVKKTLEKYGPRKKHALARIALTRSPLSVSDYARLLDVDEDVVFDYLFCFEHDFLFRRAYLEEEDVFCLEHSLKQEQIVFLLSQEFSPRTLAKDLASYFEKRISYPSQKGMVRFWADLRNTIYYYGLIKDREANQAYDFYLRLIEVLRDETSFADSLKEVFGHPYLKDLKTNLKIIRNLN